MLYILSGPDDFSLNQALDEIKRGIGDQTVLAVNTTVLDGQKVTLDQLRAIGGSVPFLAEKRLVIIQGLLERFKPKDKSARQKKTTPAVSPPDEHKSLATGIREMPESTVIVLTEGEITSNNPLLKELAGKSVVKTFSLLKDAQLRPWVQRRVTEEGSSISPPAVGLLMKLVGGNLWIMASEINKLARFASGRRIEEDDVEAVVSYTQQASVFTMVDAIVELKAELAQRLLQQWLMRGATPAHLLFMLYRQVNMIVRARELRNQGKPRMEIQNKLGLTWEFAFRKTLEQASRYSLPRLKEVYQQLLEADLSIKTGKYDGEMALTILIAELCRPGQTLDNRLSMGLKRGGAPFKNLNPSSSL